MGGGSVLAAEWDHRVSMDIDLLLPEREGMQDALLTRGPNAAITSVREATVCLRSRATTVSAENWVGLIVAPLRR